MTSDASIADWVLLLLTLEYHGISKPMKMDHFFFFITLQVLSKRSFKYDQKVTESITINEKLRCKMEDFFRIMNILPFLLNFLDFGRPFLVER
jgi:hypothetical protein